MYSQLRKRSWAVTCFMTEGYTRSIGARGDLHQRNARPLINIGLTNYLTASDSTLHFPEQQINNPMFNEHPIELGIKGNEERVLRKIKADKYYQQQFTIIFPDEESPVTKKNIQYDIATFIKTIISFNCRQAIKISPNKTAYRIVGFQSKLFFTIFLKVKTLFFLFSYFLFD